MNFIKQELFSIDNCLKNPRKLYIFGDNVLRKGKAGQAVIRDCPNVYGIPTKWAPRMDEDAFFHDTDREIKLMKDVLKQFEIYLSVNARNFDTVVYPINGLGTGLAKLPIKSPTIYKMIVDYFEHMNNMLGV